MILIDVMNVEAWLMELLVAILIGVAIGVLAMVGSLRQVVKNGLQERMVKAEEWIEWLIQDRITEARIAGRPIVKPPQDISHDPQEMSEP